MDNVEFQQPIEVTLQEYNKIQILWIDTHKWYLSEKLGYDVGFNYASISWVETGLALDFRQRFRIIKK